MLIQAPRRACFPYFMATFGAGYTLLFLLFFLIKYHIPHAKTNEKRPVQIARVFCSQYIGSLTFAELRSATGGFEAVLLRLAEPKTLDIPGF